jgi:hypothetical protein
VEREGTAGAFASADSEETEGTSVANHADDTHGPGPLADKMSSPVLPTAADAEGLREGGGGTTNEWQSNSTEPA